MGGEKQYTNSVQNGEKQRLEHRWSRKNGTGTETTEKQPQNDHCGHSW
jgi:hypothetical protein